MSCHGAGRWARTAIHVVSGIHSPRPFSRTIRDGRSFGKSFHLGCMLPDPIADGFQDMVWLQNAKTAYRLSPDPIVGARSGTGHL